MLDPMGGVPAAAPPAPGAPPSQADQFLQAAQGYFNAALFLPTLAARLLQRALPKATDGMEHASKPGLVNDLLTLAFRAELPLLDRAPLPFGTSAYCVAERT